MAEDEIRKHAKTTLRILRDKETGWKHKLKDIILEMLIIIFAVSISIWFHNWSEKLQDHHDERIFLTGFKQDLQADIANIKSSRDFYQTTLHGLQYFIKVGTGDTLSKDSLKKYGNLLFSSTELVAHSSRYEALKSSGRLGIIENPALLNNIIDLNESILSRISILNGYYLTFSNKTGNFIQQNAQLDKPGNMTNAQQVLQMSQMRFLISFDRSIIASNLIPAHNDGIEKCNELIKEIDKELK